MNGLRIAAAGVAVAAAGFLAVSLLRKDRDDPVPAGPGTAGATGAVGAAEAAPGKAAPRLPARIPTVGFVIGSAADGRWGQEPCNRMAGGGLYSLPALRDEMKAKLPLTVSAFLSDIGPGPGDLGRAVAHFVWTEIVDELQFPYVALGPADLALGSDFIRAAIAPIRRSAALCANATDAGGHRLLPGWRAEADPDRRIAIVGIAVVAESLQAEIAAAGSDVRLVPAAESAAAALREAEAAVARQGLPVAHRFLLVHGTMDEAAAIVETLPGLSFAVAARGGVLGEDRPRVVAGVPVWYPGRGLRFGVRLVSPEGGPVDGALIRMGAEMQSAGSPISGPLAGIHDFVGEVGVAAWIAPEDRRPSHPAGDYVGAARCAICHTEQSAAHETSPHRRARRRLEGRLYRTNTQCLSCHATGTFFRGGWKGPDDTSDLGGVSCEACHGPGSKHAEDPKAGWGRVEFADCRRCHQPERTPDFDPQEIWRSRGHGTR